MTSTKNALVIISSANLSPTEHLLLKHFIESAIDSDLASQYLISRLGQAAQYNENTEICLRHFKQDWRKLATRREFAETMRGPLLLFHHADGLQ